MRVGIWASSLTVMFGCSASEPARPQLLLVISTDLLPAGELAATPQYSASASIDTLRVDLVEPGGGIREFREFFVNTRRDWPVSFGIPTLTDRSLRLRIRLFRGVDTTRSALDDTAVVEPKIQLAIDRVVDLPIARAGLSTVKLQLHGACMGRPVSFLGTGANCIDAARLRGSFADGVGDSAQADLALGTFDAALEKPCSAPAIDSAICVPGGFMIMGSDGSAPSLTADLRPSPLRPVNVSAFYMDKTEYTVGRYRQSVRASGAISPAPTSGTDRTGNACTLSAAASSANLPLNCIEKRAAEQLCTRDGGRLPTEAEWEFAAQGRGERRLYPWGSKYAACCTAALEQNTPSLGCRTAPLGLAGSHADPAVCPEAVDVARDGILDMGGSLLEWVSDGFVPYSRIAGAGIEVNPYIPIEAGRAPVVRGGTYLEQRGTAATSLRTRSSGNAYSANGFRCAYPGAVQ